MIDEFEVELECVKDFFYMFCYDDEYDDELLVDLFERVEVSFCVKSVVDGEYVV